MPDRPAHEPDLNDLRESQSRRDHGMTRGPLRPAVPVGGVTVADDLATLRDYRPDDSRGFSQRRFDAALDRVEAEIARLTQERDEFDAALALVETALAAAENYVEHAYPSLLRGKRDPNHPLLSALAAALRAVREGAA